MCDLPSSLLFSQLGLLYWLIILDHFTTYKLFLLLSYYFLVTSQALVWKGHAYALSHHLREAKIIKNPAYFCFLVYIDVSIENNAILLGDSTHKLQC